MTITATTTKGKPYALEALKRRRFANEKRIRIDNASLVAGSPMHYDCVACGADIAVPEDWLTRPDLCPECEALKACGWLTE
jgi:hypothetical protein